MEKIRDAELLIEKGREISRQMKDWLSGHPCPTRRDEMESWYREKDEFRRSLKLSDESEFNCDTCRDTGWLEDESEAVVPCPGCSGFNKGNAMRKYAGVSQRFQDKTFQTFSVEVAPMMQKALEGSLLFVEGTLPWLVMAGNMGCGKTHLACAIANEMATRGWKVRFWVVADLLDRIRASFDLKYGGADAQRSQGEIDAMVYEPEVLILDDLGAEQHTSWVEEELFKIIDRRYREGRFLVVTSNEPIGNLPDRLTSRFGDKEICRLVVCKSPDYRPKMRGRGKGV